MVPQALAQGGVPEGSMALAWSLEQRPSKERLAGWSQAWLFPLWPSEVYNSRPYAF